MPNTHAQISENDDVIRAISEGQVDAFVISGSDEPQVVTLSTADLPYRLLTDRMLQGAVTVAADATILYANKPFARLIGVEAEHLPGTTLKQMVLPDDVPLLEAILARADAEPVDAELTLVRDGVNVPVRIEADKPFAATGAVCLVVTDLSELRLHEAVVAAEALGRSILDQAVDAIVVCDARDDVIRASKSSHLLCDCNPLLQPFEAVFPLSSLGDTLDLDAVRRGHVLRNASFEMRGGGRDHLTAGQCRPRHRSCGQLGGCRHYDDGRHRAQACGRRTQRSGRQERRDARRRRARASQPSVDDQPGSRTLTVEGRRAAGSIACARCSQAQRGAHPSSG